MKSLIIKTLKFSGIVLLALASCKKDDQIVTVNTSTTTAGTLAASSTSPTLTKATLTNTAVTFTGTNPNYGYK